MICRLGRCHCFGLIAALNLVAVMAVDTAGSAQVMTWKQNMTMTDKLTLRDTQVTGLEVAVDDDVDETIKKVAKADGGNSIATWSKVANGGAKVLGQLLAGQTPSALQIATDFLPVLLGMIDPLLGAAASFFMSFLGGLFSGSHDTSLYDQLSKEIVNIASSIYRAERIKDIHLNLEDKVEVLQHQVMLGSPSAFNDTAEALDGYKRSVFSTCYDNINPPDQDCTSWEQGGTVQYAMFFASLHLHTIIAQANQTSGNAEQVRAYAHLYCELGSKYASLVDHSFETFRSYRLGDAIKTGTSHCQEHIYGIQRPFWACDLEGGVDVVRGNYDFIGDCGINVKYCHSQDCGVAKCYNAYRLARSEELDKLKEQTQVLHTLLEPCSELSSDKALFV